MKHQKRKDKDIDPHYDGTVPDFLLEKPSRKERIDRIEDPDISGDPDLKNSGIEVAKSLIAFAKELLDDNS